jgi:hypothetical protein
MWRLLRRFILTLDLNKLTVMIIERTNSEIVIRVSSKINTYGLQRLVDYLRYQELTSTSQAKQSDIDALAKEVNMNWWDKNKQRFIPE